MNNIHVLPTDKPSRLSILNSGKLNFGAEIMSSSNSKSQNIYITSDEEIKPNVYALINKVLCKTELLESKIVSRQLVGGATMDICKSEYLEIILTTDQDLIKDGVQSIDDEFLEWFVKNPSCEEVEVKKGFADGTDYGYNFLDYKIIIPKEEPKYPIGGYAPGYYGCTCVTCKTEFMGDKRAVQCEPCAISMTKEEPKMNNNKQTAVENGRRCNKN